MDGGCHCGAVRYTCTAAPELTFYCYCRDCQKATGSLLSVELMVPRSAVAVSGRLDSYELVADTGNAIRRKRCPQCQSCVFLEGDGDPEYLFLTAGCLDDPSLIAPEMHIWTDAKPSWLQIADGLPQYAKNPPE